MVNLISGIFAAAIFIAFVGGLAESIGVLPFALIVGSVVIMMLIDFAQSVKKGMKKNKADQG